MGEIDHSADGDSDNTEWSTHISLDAPDSPMHGKPINVFTNRNTFDDFAAAMERTVAVRENPQDEVDYPFEDGQSVNVEVTKTQVQP